MYTFRNFFNEEHLYGGTSVMGGKGQHNGSISSGSTATSSNPSGVNVHHVNITRPSKYILTVGFEVNYPNAYINGVQDLSVDYGHAFFYITKDNKVTVFFSFGPDGLATPGKLTDEYSGPRPGNTSYSIGEISVLYRLTITENQAVNVKKAADAFTQKINSGIEHYNASMNDTCAETARDILDEGGVSTPDGSGPIKGIGIDWITTNVSFVNPYKWNEGFSNKYGVGINYYGESDPGNLQLLHGEYVGLDSDWILSPNDDDPLLLTSQTGVIHGSLEGK